MAERAPTSPSSSHLGGHELRIRAACDDCAWEAETRKAAYNHHRATGHNCWAERAERWHYGNPLTSWMRNAGLTDTTDRAAS